MNKKMFIILAVLFSIIITLQTILIFKLFFGELNEQLAEWIKSITHNLTMICGGIFITVVAVDIKLKRVDD